ncbi:MAG: HD domain-containing protein [Acidimicrobiales bacterium]
MGSPTTGAAEGRERHWAASPRMARLVRITIFALPIVGAWSAVRVVSDGLYRPDHPLGIVVWAVQAITVASATSLLIDRLVSRFLPLASLLGLSLTFPDQAPSRFSVALKAGTIRKLEAHLAEASQRGLAADEAAAARQAIELVTLLGRHERLTRGHTERVRAYSELIAKQMGIDDESRQRLAWAALLHDIGKLTVPSYILNSDGKPSDEEWQILRGHPAAGEAFVEPLADWLGEWRGPPHSTTSGGTARAIPWAGRHRDLAGRPHRGRRRRL